MSCPFETEVLLRRDGNGDVARRLVLEAHLARCESCARLDEALEILEERLRAGDEAPLGVLGRVRYPPRRRVLALATAGAAAAAAVAFATYLAWPRAESPASPAVPGTPGEVSVPVEVAKDVPVVPPGPPSLPPPGPSHGPSVAEMVGALDPDAPDYAGQVTAVAARVRARGVAGSTALASLLAAEDPRRAIDVASEAPSPILVAPLRALVGRPGVVRALAAAGAVRALVEALDGPAAAEAREALVSIGGREVASALERRITDHKGETLELLDALARIDAAAAARICASERLRASADASAGDPGAVVLARHRERLVPELRRLLSDDPYAAGAARRLGEARDRDSAAELARLATRAASAQAATEGLLGMGAFEEAFAAARRTRRARAAFDGAHGAEAYLLGRIDRGPYAERRLALELLGRCGSDATVRRLAAAPVPRNLLDTAAATLGAIGGDGAVDALARMCGERSVRRDVVRALGATGSARALPALRRFVGDEGLASELCASLGAIPERESAEMLADLALDGGAAEEAARALTSMPASVVVPVLLDRMGGQRRARELLVRITGADRGPRPEAWKEWWDSRP
jgi:hypothetical protein